MNDLHNKRPHDDLDREVHSALAAIMDTAPTPTDAPIDPALLTRYDATNNRSRVMLGAAAAIVVFAGVGGLLVLQQRDDATTSDSVPETAAPSVAAEQPAPTPPADPMTLATGFYLPSYLPDGYEITNLGAYLDRSITEPGVIRWLGYDTDGAVNAEFKVWLRPSADEPGLEIKQNTTIHGKPAMSFDSGEGIVVTWQEGDVIVSARGTEMTSAETSAAAETLVIDTNQRSADLPDGALPGFEQLGTASSTESAHPVTTNLGLTRTDGQPGGFISASTTPNTDGDTLDTMQLRLDGSERQVIGGIDRIVRIQEPDRLGPFTYIEWIDGDTIISVNGRAATAEVIAVAESYTSASFDQFAAAGASITTSAVALDVLDQATLSDGVSISVRSVTPGPDGSGAVAICVEKETPQCRFSYSESSLGGEYQNSLIAAFDVEGSTIMIAWQDTAEANRLGEATLSASGFVANPVSDQAATTTAVIGEQITTSAGRFTRVDVPDGESPPELAYQIASGQTGMTTKAPQPHDY